MKIGITLNLAHSFWSNGLNQNVKFIYEIFKRLGHDVLYITNNAPYKGFNFSHKFCYLNDLMQDKKHYFDVVITAGYEIPKSFIIDLKNRNSQCKVFSLQLGNKLMFDMRDLLYNTSDSKFIFNPLDTGEHLSGILISPHHQLGAEYLKVIYGNENVKVAPYVWDPFFIQDKIEDLKKKNLNPFFDPNKINKVQIFESNTLINKNSTIPILIAEKAHQMFPESLSGVNVFCCENLRDNEFFKSYMARLSIVKKPNFTFFNNRWCSLDALSKFGGVTVSHQYDNDLNYAHFEALYMGLPLVHNSKTLMDEGYYYPDFNVDMGAKQLQNAILNHKDVHDDYMRRGREFVAKYSPHNQSILNKYQELLDQ